MKFIEEVAVDQFVPTVRSMLAERLHEQGMTQREVAAAIGVSQSSVSKYVQGDVRRREEVLTHDRVRAVVDEIADGLASGRMEPVGALIELEVLIRELEAPGELLAMMHEEAVPSLKGMDAPVRIHDPDSPLRARERVRRSLRRGLARLEGSSAFPALIPQVGSNLVECLPDATAIEDVAAVPGRIFPVAGEVAIPDDPAFGQSQHVAGVLLAAREGGSEACAAINVIYEEALLEALDRTGHTIVEIDGNRELRETVPDVIATETDATVIAQTGGFGIEPVIYVLGSDATAVVEAVLQVAEESTSRGS